MIDPVERMIHNKQRKENPYNEIIKNLKVGDYLGYGMRIENKKELKRWKESYKDQAKKWEQENRWHKKLTSQGYTTNLGQVDESRTFALEGGPSNEQAPPSNLAPFDHTKALKKMMPKQVITPGDKLRDKSLKGVVKIPNIIYEK